MVSLVFSPPFCIVGRKFVGLVVATWNVTSLIDSKNAFKTLLTFLIDRKTFVKRMLCVFETAIFLIDKYTDFKRALWLF